MDGDSGDEGNEELTCARSDESDKSSWSADRRSSQERQLPLKWLPGHLRDRSEAANKSYKDRDERSVSVHICTHCVTLLKALAIAFYTVVFRCCYKHLTAKANLVFVCLSIFIFCARLYFTGEGEGGQGVWPPAPRCSWPQESSAEPLWGSTLTPLRTLRFHFLAKPVYLCTTIRRSRLYRDQHDLASYSTVRIWQRPCPLTCCVLSETNMATTHFPL